MNRKGDKALIVGLDIGTYKISVVVAEIGENGIEVVGIGTAPSRGLRKGVVGGATGMVIQVTRTPGLSARHGPR